MSPVSAECVRWREIEHLRRQAKQEFAIFMGSHDISIAYRKGPCHRPLPLVRIRAAAGQRNRGWLTAGGQTIKVALGRGGIRANKREGDGGTPKGTFRPLRLWWRADRHSRPSTFLPVRAIGPEDAWCEDVSSRHYNQPLRLAAKHGGDRLTRDDHLYDFIIEIDHNTRPRIAGRGSAVFLHLARKDFSPTAGCVSMTRPAMLRLLKRLGPTTRIVIG
jgi:L,D-peptidoglycan transpeptidase YkuD (ErfK/YbiS/YcfS/YnhG family)